MTCEQFWEWSASDDDALRERAEQHFAECAQCQAVREKLESSLRQLGLHEPLDTRQRQLWLQAAQSSTPQLMPASREVGRTSSRSHRAGGARVVATVSAVAVLALLAVAIQSTPTKPKSVAKVDSPIPMVRTQSPVSIIPLTWALYFGQIEQDLQTAESRLEEVSEALDLVEVQRDVERTLERFRSWDD